LTAFSDPFSLYFLIPLYYFMVAEENHGSMQRFRFFIGKFPGGWYPKGLTAKHFVLERFGHK